ncbi:DUF2599 domain-containing protein [Mycolicibacterium brumae]|uniref:DUF2599 domain-containing protein n=1 Tax=Mycolicibacterium brumae TaxID=85968 RepID=A0A2G5PGQ3_9MYCO|nr:DUF2599 domain-containing protein [Mycolicibacterium brumae]MCV7192505.1 DUF2599 domain-containing protein [Mycolicibacterium brumae]PIB77496.1 DUF2599 domain-containing protein [Mycolicibacterium brumae]RWA18503.1 hypothetical protein MBRU_04610 [Mycolicibacterium brumae DSM 44177]UWW10273.1 DUF2599 domain-containing protein [Mycolicibacterium brumae]
MTLARAAAIAAIPVGAALALAGPAAADTGGQGIELVSPPPYVERTEWVTRDGRASLRVYPTASARIESVRPLSGEAPGREAWSEVLAAAPDADTPGMRAQFLCHWHWAELGQPGKTSWNLEPWRPVVDDAQMVLDHCNPGDAEEPF